MQNTVVHLANKIKQQISKTPQIAIVLGSGLGEFANKLENQQEISYHALKGMPKSTVKGHEGKFVFGELSGKSVVCMQGRFHLYEGYTAKEVALPIYILKKLGVETLIITNAGGAVNKAYAPGQIVAINDYINFTGTNPLIGTPLIETNSRFIDASEPYNKEYIKQLNAIAKKQGIKLHNGTYMQFTGPTYETNAEIRLAKAVGADVVGMSTVIETIASMQLNLKISALSVITNMATGVLEKKVNHTEVLDVAKLAGKDLTTLLLEFVKNL